MPKIGSVWVKSYTDKDGNSSIRHSGKVVIDGVEHYLDLYPQAPSQTGQGPTFSVYLKPTQKPEDISF
jgi:hypothetical protein